GGHQVLGCLGYHVAGGGHATHLGVALHHEDLLALLGQVGGGPQAVVGCAHHDHVEISTHCISPPPNGLAWFWLRFAANSAGDAFKEFQGVVIGGGGEEALHHGETDLAPLVHVGDPGLHAVDRPVAIAQEEFIVARHILR